MPARGVRLPAPSPAQRRARLTEELAVSVRALRGCTATYEQRRWSPGKLEPVADALWRASDGYLDVLDALHDTPTTRATTLRPSGGAAPGRRRHRSRRPSHV